MSPFLHLHVLNNGTQEKVQHIKGPAGEKFEGPLLYPIFNSSGTILHTKLSKILSRSPENIIFSLQPHVNIARF